jgi:DNA-binding NarL/FixJ family response regulator
MILSSNLKTKNNSGDYIDLLYQMCICFTETYNPTVYSIQINTDVSHLMESTFGYHYYTGNDISFFRYPDRELLKTGYLFTQREFEIIKSISQGLESHEIAKKLFLSVHTVNTHRRNILSKTGNRSTHELVIELQERGLI